MAKQHASYWWRRDERQLPSLYQFSIDGEPLTCFLVTKREAADPKLYDWILEETGLSVHAIGVAAGHGEADYPYQMKVLTLAKPIILILSNVHHKGKMRKEGIEALWAECKVAIQRGRAILVHCNESFHQGPMLLAAMMLKSGMTFGEAMEYIGSKRHIYGGHFLEHSLWPARERDGKHTREFLQVQAFVKSLEKVRRERSSGSTQAVASGLQPEAAASERQAESGQKAPRQNVKEEDVPSGLQPASTPATEQNTKVPEENEADAVDYSGDTDTEDASAWTDEEEHVAWLGMSIDCLLYTSPSPRD